MHYNIPWAKPINDPSQKEKEANAMDMAALQKELLAYYMEDEDAQFTDTSHSLSSQCWDTSSSSPDEFEDVQHVIEKCPPIAGETSLTDLDAEIDLRRSSVLSSTIHSFEWHESDNISVESEGSFFESEMDEGDLYLAACTCEGTPPPSSRVHWGTVHLRDYAITVVDHPVTGDSCPLGLDWNYEDQGEQDLVSFENKRFFWRTAPRRLGLLERRQRIREVLNLSTAQVEDLERQVHRRLLLQSIEHDLVELRTSSSGAASPSIHNE